MSIKHIFIDGKNINSESDFHKKISQLLDFGPFYGENLDALWDMLSSGMGGGFYLHWLNSKQSKENLGVKYEKIIYLFNETKKITVFDKFDYSLE